MLFLKVLANDLFLLSHTNMRSTSRHRDKTWKLSALSDGLMMSVVHFRCVSPA